MKINFFSDTVFHEKSLLLISEFTMETNKKSIFLDFKKLADEEYIFKFETGRGKYIYFLVIFKHFILFIWMNNLFTAYSFQEPFLSITILFISTFLYNNKKTYLDSETKRYTYKVFDLKSIWILINMESIYKEK